VNTFAFSKKGEKLAGDDGGHSGSHIEEAVGSN